MESNSIEIPFSAQVTEARRFYLPSEPETNLAVVCGGWEKCASNYRVERSDFPLYCIEFVADGEGVLELKSTTHTLQRGAIFAYGPHCAHSILTHPKNVLSKYFIDFEGTLAEELLRAVNLLPGTCKVVAQPHELQSALDQLISSSRQSRKFSARIAALELETLLLKIADETPPDHFSHQSFQTFQRCRNYIDAHFLEVETAMEVASKCHVGAEYLSRLFRRFGSESLYRYLLRKKMNHAAEWLDSGRYNISEVAEKMGMEPFHFSRIFRRVYSTTPSAFASRRAGSVSRNL